MGRRKPFIDKKHATTYSLVCEEGPQVQPSGPRAFLDDPSNLTSAYLPPFEPEGSGGGLTEKNRKEIMELGLPDDGYDYLQHVRDPAKEDGDDDGEDAVAAAAAGPKMFLPAPYLEPPSEDVRLFDARGLPLQRTEAEEEDSLHFYSSVAAFTREIEEQPLKRAHEVDALTEVTRLLERVDDPEGAHESGNLMDDFVITATRKASTAAPAAGEESDAEEASSTAGSEDSSQDGVADDLRGRPGGQRAGSIASTYWRPKRNDRGGLSVIDERFERLALDYDSDELGELDMDEQSEGSAEPFDVQLVQQIAGHVPEEDVGQEIRHYTSAPGAHDAAAAAAGDDDARIAVRKAKELISAGVLHDDDDVVPAHTTDTWAARAWDCESVLSRQTNLDNHPGVLEEPRREGRPRMAPLSGSGSRRDMRQTGSTAAAPEHSAEAAEAQPAARRRSPNETPEEKRERKAEVKVQKRVARQVKKATKEMYKAGAAGSRTASFAEGGIRVFPLT